MGTTIRRHKLAELAGSAGTCRGQRGLNGIRGQAPGAVRRFSQDNLRAPARYGAQAMSWDEITPSGGPEIMSCVDEPGRSPCDRTGPRPGSMMRRVLVSPWLALIGLGVGDFLRAYL